jgi:hypothetical protein
MAEIAKISKAFINVSDVLNETKINSLSAELGETKTQFIISMFTHQKPIDENKHQLYKLFYDEKKNEEYVVEIGEFLDEDTTYISTKEMCFSFIPIETIMDNLLDEYTNKKFAFFSLYINFAGVKDTNHSNVLVLNKKTHKAWLFDPNGSDRIDYRTNIILKAYFKSNLLGYKYVQKKFKSIHSIGKIPNGGLCHAWCLYIIYILTQTSSSSSIEELEKLSDEERGKHIYKFINYIESLL